VRICAVSDLHNQYYQVEIPECDVLLVAGDISYFSRSIDHFVIFNDWIGTLPCSNKLVIAGNHDEHLQKMGKDKAKEMLSNCTYLEDEEIVIDGFKFYGSPWQLWFHNWAFNVKGEDNLKENWDMIPNDTDVLITHSPPHGILDYIMTNHCIGSEALTERVFDVQPKLHVFGHAHLPGGRNVVHGNTLFCNVSVGDKSVKNPTLIDIIDGKAEIV